jgi:hypothetical protein
MLLGKTSIQPNLSARGKYSESDKNPIRFSSTDQRKFATQLFRNHESLAEFKTACSNQHQFFDWTFKMANKCNNRCEKCYRNQNAPNGRRPAESLKILTDVTNPANKLAPKKFDGRNHNQKPSINTMDLKHDKKNHQ